MNYQGSPTKSPTKSSFKNSSHSKSNSPIKKRPQNVTATISFKIDTKNRRPQTVQSFSTNCSQSRQQSNRNILRQINLRMKGVRCVSGKVLKGFVKDTATKLSIGSIPSNHETIVIDFKREMAFGSSEPRNFFNGSCQNNRFMQIQSKGNQDLSKKVGSTLGNSSKKGFGLASTGQYINFQDKNSSEMQVKEVNKMKEQFYKTIENEKNKLNQDKIQSPSFSKKGYGTLIAKEKRDMLKNIMNGQKIAGPGPGSYEIDKNYSRQNQRRLPQKNSKGNRKFGSRNSPYYKKIKQLICTVNSLQKMISPGPADYFIDPSNEKLPPNEFNLEPDSKRCFNDKQADWEGQEYGNLQKQKGLTRRMNEDIEQTSPNKRNCGVSYKKPGQISPKTFNNGWQSSFKTKVKRDGYIEKKNIPGPGHYEIDEGVIKNANANAKAQKDRKRKQDQRQNDFQNQKSYKEQRNKLIPTVVSRQFYSLKANKGKAVPGPGAYEHKIPQLKPLYQRIKNSHNFIEGTIDRFGEYTGQKYHQGNFLLSEQDQKPVILAPGSYEIASSFEKAIKKRMIQSSAFMSQAKREIFKDSQKKYGPCLQNSVEQLQQEKRSYNLNIFNVWH